MDKHEETRTWLRFFKDASIPKETGASYAHIFVENRIHKDMLSDLTVDYLRLMGITLMGDIIAILRHCKSVHQDSVRKVVILQSKDERRSLSSSSSSSSEESSDDDVQMVEVTDKSIKRTSASTKTTENNIKKEPVQKNEVKQVKSQVVGKIVSSAPAKVSVIEKKAVHSLKRKYDDDDDNSSQEDTRTNQSNSGKSILRSSALAVKKISVTSDNDMIGPKLPPPKKTVFERLGAETEPPQVSSTTEVPLVETKFTRIISNVNLPLKSVNTTTEDDSLVSSVFKRLGDVKDSPQVRVTGTVLPYAGVLKSPPSIKKPVRISKPVKIVRGTMRADEPEVPVQNRASTSDARKFTIRVGESTTSVKSRPKTSQPTKTALLRQKTLNVGSQGIFANESQPTSVSVKQRLGLTSSDEVHSTSTIKKRLNRSYLPTVKKLTSIYDKDSRRFTPRSLVERLDTKKVSFGRIERKSMSPVGFSRSSGSSRPNGGGRLSIHSRLGRTRTS